MSLLPGIGPQPAGHTPDQRYSGFPPWIFPPRGATPVNVATATPVAVAPGAKQVVLEYVIPNARALTIEWLFFNATDPGGLPYATWSAQVDGEFLEGYGDVPVGLGDAGDSGRVHIVVQRGREARLRVLVTNGSPGSTFSYVARIRGFLWSDTR